MFAQADVTGFIGYLLAGFVALAGTVAYLYRALMAKADAIETSLKAENADLKAKVKSLETIADEGRETALQIANWYRTKYEGKAPIIPLVPVVPEANSPSTERQRVEARIATLRAGLAEIRLATGLEPRPTPEKAVEHGVVPQPPKPASKVQVAMSVADVLGVKDEIRKIPEATAKKVVEKLQEPPQPMH